MNAGNSYAHRYERILIFVLKKVNIFWSLYARSSKKFQSNTVSNSIPRWTKSFMDVFAMINTEMFNFSIQMYRKPKFASLYLLIGIYSPIPC